MQVRGVGLGRGWGSALISLIVDSSICVIKLRTADVFIFKKDGL